MLHPTTFWLSKWAAYHNVDLPNLVGGEASEVSKPRKKRGALIGDDINRATSHIRSQNQREFHKGVLVKLKNDAFPSDASRRAQSQSSMIQVLCWMSRCLTSALAVESER